MTANTPIWAIPYPVSTDPPNVPLHVENATKRIDTVMQLRVVSATSDVAAPYTNQIVFSATDLRMYRYTGSAWVPLNPSMPAGVLTDTVDRNYAASTASWIGLATVTEQSTISGNTMVAGGTGGTSSANSPTITIREGGLYEVGLRATFATDGSNGTPVKVIGVTVNSTSATITRANCLTSENAPTQAATTQSEGQGVTAMAEERFVVGDVLRPVMVASGSVWINSGSASLAQGGKARFWAHKIRD